MNKNSVDEYVRLMTTVLERTSARAPAGHKDRLATELDFLQSWSAKSSEKSDYRDLAARHRAILMLMRAVNESMPASVQRELDGEVREAALRAARLIDDFAAPRTVQKRLDRACRSDNAELNQPIFLISCWRSGSTLLSALLGSHKHLVALPELNLLDHFVMANAELTRNTRPLLYRPRPLILDACNSALRLDITAEKFYEHFSVFIDAIVSTYVQGKAGRRWIYKEGTNPESLDLIDIMFGYRAQFVWLIRHGLDVVNSEIERYERHAIQCPDVSDYAREWTVRNELYADFCDRVPKRCIKVRYEDLVVNPIAQTRRLLEFLGEPWDEEIFARLQSSNDLLGGDHKFTRSEGVIDSTRRGRWKEWPPVFIAQLGRIVNPMLSRAGYETVSEPQVPSASSGVDLRRQATASSAL